MDNDNLTPPERSGTPNWDKRYTPNRNDSVSKSPRTPPLRPSSNISIYSDTSRRTPPLAQKYTSSPHTPPIVPRKSTSVAVAAYHNSPIDVDANSSGSHSHSHWQNSINNQIGNSSIQLIDFWQIFDIFLSFSFTGSNRRNVSSYSPSSHSSKRRRGDKGYERSSDYHYPSKRSGDNQTQRHSREPITETYDLTTSSSRLSSSGRKRRAAHSPSPIRLSKRHSRSHSPRAFRSAASPVYYMSRSNRNKSG